MEFFRSFFFLKSEEEFCLVDIIGKLSNGGIKREFLW